MKNIHDTTPSLESPLANPIEETMAEELIALMQNRAPGKPQEYFIERIQDALTIATGERRQKDEDEIPPTFTFTMQIIDKHGHSFDKVEAILQKALDRLNKPHQSAKRRRTSEENFVEGGDEIRSGLLQVINEVFDEEIPDEQENDTAPPPTIRQPELEITHQAESQREKDSDIPVTLPSREFKVEWNFKKSLEAAQKIADTFLLDLLENLAQNGEDLPSLEDLESREYEQLEKYIDEMYPALRLEQKYAIIDLVTKRCRAHFPVIRRQIDCLHQEIARILEDPEVDAKLKGAIKEAGFRENPDEILEDFITVTEGYEETFRDIRKKHISIFSSTPHEEPLDTWIRKYMVWNVYKLKLAPKPQPRSTPPKRIRSNKATVRGGIKNPFVVSVTHMSDRPAKDEQVITIPHSTPPSRRERKHTGTLRGGVRNPLNETVKDLTSEEMGIILILEDQLSKDLQDAALQADNPAQYIRRIFHHLETSFNKKISNDSSSRDAYYSTEGQEYLGRAITALLKARPDAKPAFNDQASLDRFDVLLKEAVRGVTVTLLHLLKVS